MPRTNDIVNHQQLRVRVREVGEWEPSLKPQPPKTRAVLRSVEPVLCRFGTLSLWFELDKVFLP